MSRSLSDNFGWTLAGNVVYGGCQWAMLVAIARFGTPTMAGIYALAQALTAPIILFSNLQLRALQATECETAFRFGHYLALRFITTTGALLGIGLVVLIGHFTTEILLVTVTVGVAKSVESISDVYFGLLQRNEEMSVIARSMILKGLLSVTALSLAVYLTKRLVVGAVAITTAWLLVMLFYDRQAPARCKTRYASPIWEMSAIWRLSRLALPLGVTMMLISLNTSLPRYFLQHYVGTRQLGLFSVLATIQTAGMLVIMALGNVALPRLASCYSRHDWPGFRNLTFLLLLASLAMGIATVAPVIIGGDRLVTSVFGREYAGQNRTFIWLSIGAAVSYCTSTFGYAATAARKLTFQPFALALVAASTAIGCFLLVPSLGALGAALATCGSGAVGCGLYLASFCASARMLVGETYTDTSSLERIPA